MRPMSWEAMSSRHWCSVRISRPLPDSPPGVFIAILMVGGAWHSSQGRWSSSTRAGDLSKQGRAALATQPYTSFTNARAVQAQSKRLDRGDFKEKTVVNKQIRWRIISLQAMLVVILAAASGFLFFQGNFVTGMVHDQLVAQKIFFPGTDQIKAGGALDPAKFSTEVTQYAGQQVDNGDKAKAYGQGFIGVHLQGVAGGKTYSEVSSANSAAQ